MKKLLLSASALMLIGSASYAQSSPALLDAAPAVRTSEEVTSKTHTSKVIRKSSVQAASPVVLWSEDFSNGIPSTWVNQGYDADPANLSLTPNPLANWEYRGPSTNPSNAVGSRGAYAGPLQSGNQGTPLMSPTAGNGFIIFDSDYLDDGGNRATPGGGLSPAPHVGTLTTDTMDLSSSPNVEVAFHSYARVFFAEFDVAVSDDGGLTFSDTVKFHTDLAVNVASGNGDEVAGDISAVAGGKSNVVLRFIFDGRLSNPNGFGYYYWMLDDIEVRELPAHAFRFVDAGGAPAHDVIYPSQSPKYGNVQIEQVQPISFDSNIYNYGAEDQNNVKLVVTVEDASGNAVASLSSPVLPTLDSKDTGRFSNFTTTGSWTPSAVGSYNVIFTVESDSVPVSPNSLLLSDTIPINVNDSRYSFSFGSTDNFVGTDNLATGNIIAIGEAFLFSNPNRDTTGYVFVDGMSVPFSTATDPTATIIWEVYDTTGFTYGATGGPVGNPLFFRTYQLDSSALGSTYHFDFRTKVGGDSIPLSLFSNAGYLFIMNMIPNATDGVVRIANDQTVAQPLATVPSVVVQSDGPNWFGRFGNSPNLSSPIMNLFVAETPEGSSNPPNALEAFNMQNAVKIYPNPSNGDKVNIAIAQGGEYTLEVVSVSGKTLRSETISVNGNDVLYRDFSSLPKGIYMVNIFNDNFSNTQRLSIK